MALSATEIKGGGTLGFKADFAFHLVDLRREIARWGHLPPAELAKAIPCMDLEHRHGVCPLGFDHSVRDVQGHNTAVKVPKQSLIYQLTGTPGPTSLLVTRIATGTSADATAQSMTQLGVETYRKAPSDCFPTGGDLQMQVFWYFGSSEANAGVDLQEHGVLIGGATDTPGSGSLGFRFLQQFGKTTGINASGSYLLNAA